MSTTTSNLPEGWDEARIRNATPQELDALSEEDFSLIQNHIASQIRYGLGANEPMDPTTISPSLPDQVSLLSKPIAPFVDALRKTHTLGDDWGFAVFRLDYSAATDTSWNTYTTRLPSELQTAVHTETLYAADGMEEARAGLGVLWADDSREEVHGHGLGAVRQEYRVMRERGDVPPGMDHGICLVADVAAVRSLERAEAPLVGGSTTTTTTGAGESAPYVLAVDVEWEGQEREKDEDGYGGYFKVAVASLLTELYPVIATGILTPKELALMVEEGEVWTGVA